MAIAYSQSASVEADALSVEAHALPAVEADVVLANMVDVISVDANVVPANVVDGSVDIGGDTEAAAGPTLNWTEACDDDVAWEEDEEEYVGLHDEQPYEEEAENGSEYQPSDSDINEVDDLFFDD